MTEKIIIDGVDVSECDWFDNGDCNCEILDYGTCTGNSCCYYKQLQREKQNSQEARDTSIKEFNRAERYKQVLKKINTMAKYDCEFNCSLNSETCKVESCLEKRIQREINEALKDENRKE